VTETAGPAGLADPGAALGPGAASATGALAAGAGPGLSEGVFSVHAS